MADGNETAAVDSHHTAATHTLGTSAGCLHVDDTSIDDDAVVGTQAVKSHAVDVDFHTGTHTDVVVTADASTPLSNHTKFTLTAEDNLSLAEECGFLVFLLDHDIVGTILQAINRAVSQHEIHGLATLIVDGSTARIGDFSVVEHDLEALVSVKFQRAISGLTTHLKLHRARHIHYCDMIATGLHNHTWNSTRHHRSLTAKSDTDDLVPSSILHIVVIGRVSLVSDRHVRCLGQG